MISGRRKTDPFEHVNSHESQFDFESILESPATASDKTDLISASIAIIGSRAHMQRIMNNYPSNDSGSVGMASLLIDIALKNDVKTSCERLHDKYEHLIETVLRRPIGYAPAIEGLKIETKWAFEAASFASKRSLSETIFVPAAHAAYKKYYKRGTHTIRWCNKIIIESGSLNKCVRILLPHMGNIIAQDYATIKYLSLHASSMSTETLDDFSTEILLHMFKDPTENKYHQGMMFIESAYQIKNNKIPQFHGKLLCNALVEDFDDIVGFMTSLGRSREKTVKDSLIESAVRHVVDGNKWADYVLENIKSN